MACSVLLPALDAVHLYDDWHLQTYQGRLPQLNISFLIFSHLFSSGEMLFTELISFETMLISLVISLAISGYLSIFPEGILLVLVIRSYTGWFLQDYFFCNKLIYYMCIFNHIIFNDSLVLSSNMKTAFVQLNCAAVFWSLILYFEKVSVY